MIPQEPTKRGLLIGLLLDTFFENHKTEIWQGIVDYAEELGIDLVCFVGGSLQSPYYHDAQRNTIYSLVSRENVDGLISLSGSLATWIKQEELEAFYRKWSPLPIVSIGVEIPGVYNVLVDNATGMEQLLEHLILEHHCRRIAFITGPAAHTHPDSAARLEVYRRILEKHGLTHDPQLIFSGDPFNGTIVDSLPLLIAHGGLALDAIVAANDYIAIEVIRNLKKRGYQVPQDIAVVGFDNIDESRYLPQPLTTVRQPAYELGRKAMEIILARLEGKEVPATTTLSTKIICRRSCGCYLIKELTTPFTEDKSRPAKTQPDIDAFKENTTHVIYAFMDANFTRFRNKTLQSDWAAKLVECVLADLQQLSVASFLPVLENIVTEAIIADIEILTWHKILIELFSRLKQWITGYAQNTFLDSLFKRALELIWEIAVRSLTYVKLKAEEKDEMLFTLSQAFITAFDIHKLAEIIERELPALGIGACYISLYRDKAMEPQQARLVVSSDRSLVHAQFNATALIPGGLKKLSRRFSLIAMSLYYQDEQLGFILFEIGNTTVNVYETLVVQISGALKSIQLLQEVQKHATTLETTVKARTRDLHEANERLKQEIIKREETATVLQKKNEEIEELNKRLEEKSRIDSLTRLYNREAFFELLEKELQRTTRELWRLGEGLNQVPEKYKQHKPSGNFKDHIGTLTIMLIDIDHFKSINDSFGHLVGDDVLKALGNLFNRKDILRGEDFVGRFGGEEFIIVCPNTNADNAYELSKRLADEFQKMKFLGKSGTTFSVTLSIGVASFTGQDSDPIAIINKADKAMYYAKQHGRNQIAVYEEVYDK